MTPKLTILIPTYNRKERLEKTLPTFLSENINDIEFLIIDNNSDDGTEALIKKQMGFDQRIRYIKNPINIGANRNIYRGFLEAKSDWITIFPDDDFIEKGFLSELMRAIKNYPEIGIIITAIKKQAKSFNETRILSKGVDAITCAYMYSGTIMGFTFDKTKIDQQKWNLDGSIYPQIRVAVHTALNHNILYLVPDKKPLMGQWGDSIIQISKSRPVDYGITERLDILDEITANLKPTHTQKKIFHKISINLYAWAISKFYQMYFADRQSAINYLNSLLNNRKIRSSVIFYGICFKILFFKSKLPVSTKFYILWKFKISTIKSLLNSNLYSSIYFVITHFNLLKKKLDKKLRLS